MRVGSGIAKWLKVGTGVAGLAALVGAVVGEYERRRKVKWVLNRRGRLASREGDLTADRRDRARASRVAVGPVTDLPTLLREATPRLREGTYVFVSLGEAAAQAVAHETVMQLRETEHVTCVLPQPRADALGCDYDYVAAWITLEVKSSLAAVGLTAVVASRLAGAGISCNVVAGYHHDHLFVPVARAEEAVALLDSLSA